MYLIVGGNGYLGSYIIKNIIERSNEKILATHIAGSLLDTDNRVEWIKCDVTDYEDLHNLKRKISNNKVKVVYLAGYIKPDDVEKNPDIAWKVNIGGVTKFIDILRDNIECLYFASTDMAVGESFDDYKFKEVDISKPVNRYGMQKHICEQIVNDAGFNVFRCPLMVGKSLISDRPHFIEHVERVVQNKEYFDILSDYYESSLDYNSVASLLVELIEKYGGIEDKIIHICGDEKISKLEIAKRHCKKNGLDDQYLKPLLLKDCDFFVAKRCDILLDNSLIKKYLGISSIKIEC